MEKQALKHTPDFKEKDLQNIGFLFVITGASGTGKDVVMTELLKHEIVTTINLNRVITCTDRPIRDNEPPDAYHFLKPSELELLAEQGELVEDLTPTGTSRKATPKSEIERLLSGQNLLWRIDPSRAAEVATGDFFDRHFPQNAQILKEHTLVICINAPRDVIESRRKKREGEKYKPQEFELRDKQEAPHLDILLKKAVVIENIDGQLSKTVEMVVQTISNHHSKIKNVKK